MQLNYISRLPNILVLKSAYTFYYMNMHESGLNVILLFKYN